jgi:preprotein translocase subunit SecE
MQKDDKFWLNICYVLFAILTAYIFNRAFDTIGVQTGWGERYDSWWGLAGQVSSIAFGIGAAWFLKRNPERNDYFLQAINELRKVTYPTPEDTRRMTIIVCVVVGIFAVILTVFDSAWSFALRGIISLMHDMRS